jgi:hypothetical protein
MQGLLLFGKTKSAAFKPTLEKSPENCDRLQIEYKVRLKGGFCCVGTVPLLSSAFKLILKYMENRFTMDI